MAKFWDHKMAMQYLQMIEAMETFVLRCDEGSIRSKKTYAQFKNILGT